MASPSISADEASETQHPDCASTKHTVHHLVWGIFTHSALRGASGAIKAAFPSKEEGNAWGLILVCALGRRHLDVIRNFL